MAEIRQGYWYTKEHDWILIEGSNAKIGITDYAQHALGDIVFVEGEPEGTELNFGGPLGMVESVKAASEIISPLEGILEGVNETLTDAPELLNSAPFDHYIFSVTLSGDFNSEAFLDAAGYAALCEAL